MKRILYGVILTVISVVAIPAHADFITVTSLNDTGVGSLRNALVTAQQGDIIQFDPTLYGSTITLASPLVYNQSVRINGDIDGDYLPDITVRNPGGSIFDIGSTATYLAIDGLIMRDATNLVTATSSAGFAGGYVHIQNSSIESIYSANAQGAILPNNFPATGTVSVTIDRTNIENVGFTDFTKYAIFGQQNDNNILNLLFKNSYFGSYSGSNVHPVFGLGLGSTTGTALVRLENSTFDSYNSSYGLFGYGASERDLEVFVRNSIFHNGNVAIANPNIENTRMEIRDTAFANITQDSLVGTGSLLTSGGYNALTQAVAVWAGAATDYVGVSLAAMELLPVAFTGFNQAKAFTLGMTSFLIDKGSTAGNPVFLYFQDVIGSYRSYGARSDIGPVEYSPDFAPYLLRFDSDAQYAVSGVPVIVDSGQDSNAIITIGVQDGAGVIGGYITVGPGQLPYYGLDAGDTLSLNTSGTVTLTAGMTNGSIVRVLGVDYGTLDNVTPTGFTIKLDQANIYSPEISSMIRNIQFVGSTVPGHRTISVTVSDGFTESNPAMADILVTSQPYADLNAGLSGLNNSITYTVDGTNTAANVFDPATAIINTPSLITEVVVTNTNPQVLDSLTINPASVPVGITVTQTANSLTFTSAGMSAAAFETVLQNITFSTTSANQTTRSISVSVQNSMGMTGITSYGSVIIQLASVPSISITPLPSGTSVTEGSGSGGFTITLGTVPTGNVVIQCSAGPQIAFVSNSAIIPAGQTTSSIQYFAVDDTTVEAPTTETISCSVTSAPSDPTYFLSAISDTLISVNDNDAAPSSGSSSSGSSPRRGCTDPDAINYNPRARVDNGSCRYDQNQITNPTPVVPPVANNQLMYTGENPAPTVDSCDYFDQYLKKGARDGYKNVTQVSRMQKFLNEYMDVDLLVDGVFGTRTLWAVEFFQSRESSYILSPWRERIADSSPTGFWYKTTTKRANQIVGCEQQPVFLEEVGGTGYWY
jgi:lysozyme family protein